jgi:DNA-binding transcriptional LysR family regulator
MARADGLNVRLSHLFGQCIDMIGSMQQTNLSALDLNLLVVLDALLATRSTTLAAQRLSLSQPATSHALSRLREVFGDPLLVRAGRTLTPTPFAESLAPRVATALQAVRDTFEASSRFDAKTSQRTFTLAAGDYAVSVLVPQLTRTLARAAPSVDLFVKPAHEEEQSALESGDVELLLTPLDSVAPGPVISEELFRDRFVCVLRRGHPLARRGLTLDAFCELGHVLIAPRGLSRRGAVDDTLDKLKRKRRVAVAVPHFLVAPLVVTHSDYVLTLAERVARTLRPELGLTIVEPPIEIPDFEIAMHWHVRHDADPGHLFLREQLRKAARSLRR